MNWIKRLCHRHKYKLIQTSKSPTTDKSDAYTCIIKTYKCKCGEEKTIYEVIDEPYFYNKDVQAVFCGEISLREMCYQKGIMKRPSLGLYYSEFKF